MKVIPHDAVGEDAHGNAARCLVDEVEKGVKIGRFVKNRLSMVAAIHDVLHEAVRRHAVVSRHARPPVNFRAGTAARELKGTAPF
jgi:hypothetical protein